MEEEATFVAVHLLWREGVSPAAHKLSTSDCVAAVEPSTPAVGSVLLGHDHHAVPRSDTAAQDEAAPSRVPSARQENLVAVRVR